jgi:hypothetical protein
MFLNEQVNVPTGGKYGLSIRYSNAAGSDKEITVSTGGQEKALILKPTLNGSTYAEAVIGFTLLPHANAVTVSVPEGGGRSPKIDSIKPFRMYEAADAELKGSLTLEDFEAGNPVFLNDGDEMIFKIRAASAGNYALKFRYGAEDTDSEPQSITVFVNDIKKTHYLASLRDRIARSASLMNVTLKKGSTLPISSPLSSTAAALISVPPTSKSSFIVFS